MTQHQSAETERVSVRVMDLIALTHYVYASRGRVPCTGEQLAAADRATIALYSVPDLHIYGRAYFGYQPDFDGNREG